MAIHANVHCRLPRLDQQSLSPDSLPAAPTWITTRSGGQGFAELAGRLLEK